MFKKTMFLLLFSVSASFAADWLSCAYAAIAAIEANTHYEEVFWESVYTSMGCRE